jgi:hypothetical protein
MKHRLLVLLILGLAAPALAQSFLVSAYDNNSGHGGLLDQSVRIINVGKLGTPMTTPVGDVCANIYVFDADQEMIACCSCRLTPNELASAAVGNQLTSNPLTGVVPISGVVDILPIAAGTQPCSPISPFSTPDASLVQATSTHVEITNSYVFITESELEPAKMGSQQAAFLSNACLFVQYLGGKSGQGGCGCSSPGS